MDVREKLVELLYDADKACNNKSCVTCKHQDKKFFCKIHFYIDHFIANGVTFATDTNVGDKWISVKDRLPDDSIPSTFYLCYWNGYIRVCKYWRTRKVFEHRGKTVKVTHWMPLPEPPKGE
jgi:hypothetical protein